MKRTYWQVTLALALLTTTALATSSFAQQFDVLVADRGQANVYRYDSNGNFLNTVIADNTGLVGATGLALSPDLSKLYVSSSVEGTVLQYNYNSATGEATDSSVFASGLLFPSAIKFSKDGNTIFVSSNAGEGVYQFATDGSSAGDDLLDDAFNQHSGLEFAPSGELLVGGFETGAFQGGVVKANAALTELTGLVAPNSTIAGASGLAVHGDDLYVAGLYTGQVLRFDVNTGELDPTFNINLTAGGFPLYPQDIRIDLNGEGLLIGILGTGQIARFGFDGAPLGIFADATAGGFLEPTAFVFVVPEPASMTLLGGALVGLVGWRLRRNASRSV